MTTTQRVFKRSFFTGICLTVLTLFSGSAMASDLGYQEFELDNGLRVVVMPMENTPRVACRVVYNVGSANDKPGKTGMAHFLEHMMFKGTKTIRTNDWEGESAALAKLDEIAVKLDQVTQEIESAINADSEPAAELLTERDQLKQAFAEQQTICDSFVEGPQFNSYYKDAGGTGVNAWTNPDRTVYTVNLPANKLELFFLLEAERMSECVLRDFYREKQVVLEERRRAVAGAKRRYYEQVNALLWEAAPYRNPNLGWPEDVASITRADMFEYYRSYYVPNNAAIVLAGQVTLESAKTLAQTYFGELARAPKPRRLYTTNPPPAVEKTLIAEMREKPEIRLVYPTVAHHHQDADALEVLAWWLDSRSGPLYRELVVDSQLAISLSAWHYTQKLGGRFEIVLRPTDISRREEITRKIDTIISSVLKGEEGYALEESHLKAYASQWERGLVSTMSTPDGAATLLANWYFLSGIDALALRPQRVRSLTLKSAVKTAKKYVDPARRVRAFIVPPREPAPIDPRIAAETELMRQIAEEQDPEKRKLLQKILDAMREERKKTGEPSSSGGASSSAESDSPASATPKRASTPSDQPLAGGVS